MSGYARGAASAITGLRIMRCHGISGDRLSEWAASQREDASACLYGARFRKDGESANYYRGRIAGLNAFIETGKIPSPRERKGKESAIR